MAGAAFLALAMGCYEPADSGSGYDSCDIGLISVPTREPTWTEETTQVAIAGQVYHSSCDEPEREIPVTVSNSSTAFEETQTARTECVQIFPTTGATQRNYLFGTYVPLRPGANRIEVRALRKCGSLQVTCDPCVDPPPVPDAAPPGPIDAGPPCQLAVTDPAEVESTASESPITASGTLTADGEDMMWANATTGNVGGVTYAPGEPTWSALIPLRSGERNRITVYAWCAGGMETTRDFYVTHVPP